LRFEESTSLAFCYICKEAKLTNKFATGTKGPAKGWRLNFLEEHQASKQHQFALTASRERSNWQAATKTSVARAAPQTKSKLNYLLTSICHSVSCRK